MLSRFHTIPERYGRTDIRTDRFAISTSRVSMLTRDKNQYCSRILCHSVSDEIPDSKTKSDKTLFVRNTVQIFKTLSENVFALSQWILFLVMLVVIRQHSTINNKSTIGLPCVSSHWSVALGLLRPRNNKNLAIANRSRVSHFYFCNNFGRCRPFLIILSLLYSQIYCWGRWYYNDHLTSSLLPHYLAKFECATVQLYKKVIELNMVQ